MIAIVAALTGSADAHISDIIASVDVLVPSGGAPVSVEATFGLIVGQPDGSARWTCHEAVTSAGSRFLPQYDLSRDGEWLAVLRIPEEGRDGQTLLHSPAGCAWNPVEGLDGVFANYAVYDPDDPSRAFAVTTAEAGGAIHASTDGGRTWVASLEPQPDRVLQTVQVVDGEIYAAGTNLAGTQGFLWYRGDSEEWTSVALPDLGWAERAVLRILAISEDSLYLLVDPPGADLLVEADRALTSFPVVLEDQGEILDAAVTDSGLWIPVDFGQRALLLAPDGSYTEHEPPASVGATVDEDGRLLLASLAYLDGALVTKRSADGSFAAVLFPDDVLAPLDCPEGTETKDVCEPLWPKLEPRLRGFDAPSEPVEDPGGEVEGPEPAPDLSVSGCSGCRTVGPPPGLGALVGLFLAAWWRRRLGRVVGS